MTTFGAVPGACFSGTLLGSDGVETRTNSEFQTLSRSGSIVDSVTGHHRRSKLRRCCATQPRKQFPRSNQDGTSGGIPHALCSRGILRRARGRAPSSLTRLAEINDIFTAPKIRDLITSLHGRDEGAAVEVLDAAYLKRHGPKAGSWSASTTFASAAVREHSNGSPLVYSIFYSR
jgi:hypothetical protein